VNRVKFVGLATLALGVLAGCGGSSGSISSLPDPRLRFFNLSPDSTLDLRLNDDTKATNIPYGASGANFFSLDIDEEAEYDLALRATGSTIDLTNDYRTFARDTNWVVVAHGLQTFGTENSKRLQASLVNVDRTRPNGTRSRVVAFHGYVPATGNDNFPIVFKNDLTIPTISFSALNFGGFASQEIDAGPQTFIAQRQSTDGEITRVTKVFESGKIYLMYIGGVEGATGATAPKIDFFEIQPK